MAQVSITLVRALLVAAEQAGATRKDFLAEAGIDAPQLEDMHTRIPVSRYRRVVRAAYKLTADPALGLHFGERLSLASFDVIGHLTEHSANLRDALLTSARYSRIVSGGPKLELEEGSEFATIRLDLPERDTAASRLAAEFSTVSLLRLIRRFVGADALPRRVFFTHPRPKHHAEYTRLFAGTEQFSQDLTGLEIDRAWLEHRPYCHGSELREYLTNRAEFLLARADAQASTTERVTRWLETQAELARPTRAQVAHDLGISTRSLRRRLHAEHAQFNVLVEQAQAEHAKRRLRDPKQQIQETAYALGFRTASAFSRAFKRWTGLTPKAYRRLSS